jgi:hypothetical protein
MEKVIKKIEEIKAHFCVARDGMIEAAKMMDDSECFSSVEKDTRQCIGYLCLAIAAIDAELIKIRNNQ